MFKLDSTPYSEAILHPDGTRAFFLAPSGHGMPAATERLAEKVIDLLNNLSKEELIKIYGR